eukprot:SAG22_NODE_4986_length_1115_cov_1.403543_2_plen_238_part_01
MNKCKAGAKKVKVGVQLGGGDPEKKAGKKKTDMGEAINAVHLDHLRELFYEADEDGNGSLDIGEFVKMLGSVLGGHMTKEKLTLLFRRMDANLDDEVDWDEFSDFMLLESQSSLEEEEAGNEYVVSDYAEAGPFNHHGHISRICYSAPAHRYYSAGLDGTVGVWNAKNLHKQQVIFNGDGWINDMTLLGQDSGLLAVATVRSLSIYDSNTLNLIGAREPWIHSFPQCMHYWRTQVRG